MLFCTCVFSRFSISLGEENATLSVFSYVCLICACLVLSVSAPFWCLGRAAACDCGTPWTFHLPFFFFFFFRNTETLFCVESI